MIVALGAIGLPGEISEAASGPPYVYTCNLNSASVSVVSTSNNTVVKTINTAGCNPNYMAVNPAGTRVYVSGWEPGGNLAVIDAVNATLLKTVNIGNQQTGVAVTSDNNFVYVCRNVANTVVVLNASSDTIITNITVESGPVGIVYSKMYNRMYLPTMNTNNVSVIDVATNTVIARIRVGTRPYGIISNPQGTRIYVPNSGSRTVSVIDARTNTVLTTITGLGNTPRVVTISPSGDALYVTNGGSNSLSVINTTTNTVTRTIALGGIPYGVTVNPTGTRAYVALENTNAVAVIDLTRNAVIASVPVGSFPQALDTVPGPFPVSSNVNQPSVSIRECPVNVQGLNGRYNISLNGTMNITNPAGNTTLYGVDLIYGAIPSGMNLTFTGTSLYNASGGPFSATEVTAGQGVIHANNIPPLTTVSLRYVFNGTNLSSPVAPGAPVYALINESTFMSSSGGGPWRLQALTYDAGAGGYVTTGAGNGDNMSFVLNLTNPWLNNMSGISFKKQLPVAGNVSTGNAGFTTFNVSYWTDTGSIPYQGGLTPGPDNLLSFSIPGNLTPGSTLYVQVNGTLGNISGVELPPGSGNRYVAFNQAYILMSSGQPDVSYFGSLINRNSTAWFVAGGNNMFSLDKMFDTGSGKWKYGVSVDNPTNTSFILGEISVYRNNYPVQSNYTTATPVYYDPSMYALEPGASVDTGLMTDSAYVGLASEPPVYWAAYLMSVNSTAVGAAPLFSQQICNITSPPHNMTFTEPYVKLLLWKLKVNKTVTYNENIGMYVVNITVTNTGYGPVPGVVKAYDFVPSGFNATSFMKNGSSYIPDYNGALVVEGPKTIGWDIGGLGPNVSHTMSYVVNGTADMYSSTSLFVVGADPQNVAGDAVAMPADGDGTDKTAAILALMGMTAVMIATMTAILYRREH